MHRLSEEIDYKVDDLLRLLIEDNHVAPQNDPPPPFRNWWQRFF